MDMEKAIYECNNNFVTATKSEIINNEYSLNQDIYTKKISIENATKLDTKNIFKVSTLTYVETPSNPPVQATTVSVLSIILQFKKN